MFCLPAGSDEDRDSKVTSMSPVYQLVLLKIVSTYHFQSPASVCHTTTFLYQHSEPEIFSLLRVVSDSFNLF